MRRTLLVTALLAIPAVAFSQSTWYVPDDFPTIQGAINGVSDGDTIIVKPGTYFEHLDYYGKAVVLMSEKGPRVTTIDGSYSGRVVTFENGESPASVLEGFTITHGYESLGNGGGIDCTLQSSPMIKNCILVENRAVALGGGIACRGLSNPVITNCLFIGNVARGYPEGSQGGGISCFVLSNATVTDCVFIGNDSQYGGALDCSGSLPTVTNCLFIANTGDLGGAVFCSAADPIITNCTFTMNSAVYGGALVLAGVYLPSYPVMTNCVMWNDSPSEIRVFIGEPTVTYSTVQGGWPGVGNIDDDPMFVLADRQDCRLLWGSPCIDSGHPGSLDPDGTRGDMGAFFFDQDEYMTLYLTPDMTEVSPGEAFGVTYTVINRWTQPEPFWVLTEAVLPGGGSIGIMGPDQYTLPAETTVQRHLTHTVPPAAPLGLYGYRSRIGVPPSTLYDEDSFALTVVAP